SVRAERVGDQAATGEFANAAGRIASDALPQALIVHVAAVGIGREPFAYGKAVAAVLDGEPAVICREPRNRGHRRRSARPVAKRTQPRSLQPPPRSPRSSAVASSTGR